MIEQYLERLFTWDSLENTERGIEFELKNRLIQAQFEGVTTVKLDGHAIQLSDITLDLSETEAYTADEITPESPLQLDLAETVQVIADIERLRLGVHEIEIGFRVENYGDVSFTTDDEITEDDLIDIDPAEWTVDELRTITEDITEPTSFERLIEREQNGKNRTTAIDILETALADAEPLTEDEMVKTDVSDKTSGGIVQDLLVDILESPHRVSVYLAVQTLGSGTPEEIANRTVLPTNTVRSTLADFESEGIAESKDNGAYTVASPITVLQKRQQDLWNVLKNTL